MNNRHSINNALPVSGLCAFVRVAAMSLVGVDGRDPHAQHLLASKRPLKDRQEECQMHPGEEGA
ncbi:MAG: hypothetical protein ACJ8GJ_14070 [Vitreoscilla sp.]